MALAWTARRVDTSAHIASLNTMSSAWHVIIAQLGSYTFFVTQTLEISNLRASLEYLDEKCTRRAHAALLPLFAPSTEFPALFDYLINFQVSGYPGPVVQTEGAFWVEEVEEEGWELGGTRKDGK